MSRQRVGIYVARAASAAGLAAFAWVTLRSPQDSRLAGVFNVWVYDGLMVLACVIAGSRALRVEKDRAAWVADRKSVV